MATIGNDPNGRKRVLFFDVDGKRKTIRLGKVSKRQAETIKTRVELLIAAKITGTAPDDETSRWIADCDERLRDKLAAVGLIDVPTRFTLAVFLDSHLAKRQSLVDVGKLSARTLGIDRLTRDCLCDHFGPDKLLSDIGEGDAWDFRNWLLACGGRPIKRCGPETVVRERTPLDEPTVRKRCSIASRFFADAMRRDLIRRNPFAMVPKSSMATDKLSFISEADAYKVLAKLPNTQWKLLFALSRWGGLRVGSEVRLLAWADIHWDEGKITVHSPKTKRHAGHEKRTIPLFPELAPLLADRFAEGAKGDAFVLPMLVDRTDASLRDTLIRAIEDAGLTVWPRLWHNLRSSRQTDLEDRFKPKVVCSWLGNSEMISRKHYIQVTGQDYAKAAQPSSVSVNGDGQSRLENTGKAPSNELLRRVVDAAQKAAQTARVSGVCDGPGFGVEAQLTGNSHYVVPSQLLSKIENSPGGIRTPDQGIMSPLL